MPRLRDKLFPEVRLRKATQEQLEKHGNVESSEGRAWYTGIVTYIELVGLAQPLYSVKVQLDEGLTPTTDILKHHWFEPLLPIHTMRIPERFERVFITFQNTEARRVGYWMSRKNEHSYGSQKVRSKDGKSMQDQFSTDTVPYRMGTPFYDALTKNTMMGDLYKRKEGLPSDSKRWLKAFPGDVIVAGGYNSAIRQTYDPWSGKSRVQIQAGYGSMDPAKEVLDEFDNPFTVESNGGYHSSIHVLERSPFDLQLKLPQAEGGFGIPFHKDYDTYGPGAAQNESTANLFQVNADSTLQKMGALDSFIALTTYGHIRLVNVDPAAHIKAGNVDPNPICHVTKAEPLINLLSRVVSLMSTLTNAFLAHEHMHPMGPTMGGPVSAMYMPLKGVTDTLTEGLNSLSGPQILGQIASKHVSVN